MNGIERKKYEEFYDYALKTFHLVVDERETLLDDILGNIL